jgi:signal transduction histidine kinase
MDGFPFATALLSADGALRQANARWASEFPSLKNLAELLHPVDALRLRHAVRLKARMQVPVRLRRQGQWHAAQALLSPQGEHCALSLIDAVPSSSSAANHGELLGNVVHSFNNYLSAMMGFSELALLDVDATHPAYGQLQTVLESGQQAVQFTRDLLASGGRAVLQKKTFALNSWLRAQLESHDIPLAQQEAECAIEADAEWLARGLETAIAFLREGEPSVITAELSVCHFTQAAAAAMSIHAGRYAVLCLRDRGRGLDGKHLLPLFTPYYSSKIVRGRKGLGLSPLEGVLRQHGGASLALAEAGEGTALFLLLPLMSDGGSTDDGANTDSHRAWLLTDLPWLAVLAQAQLAGAGVVVAAVNQDEAQSLLSDEVRPDLLLTWRLKDEGPAAALRQTINVPLIVWTPFADHRSQVAAGITLAKFTPQAEHLRAAVSASLRVR